MTKASQRYLSILFFNQHKKVFCLVHFLVSGELLVKVQTNALNTSSINKDVSTSERIITNEMARIRRNKVSVRLRSLNPSILIAVASFHLHCLYSTSLHILSKFCWSVKSRIQRKYMRLCRSESSMWEIRTPQPIGIMAEDSMYPPRKALWCNAWRRGVGWFSVTEKVENEEGVIKRRTSLWKLDVDAEWKWRRHSSILETPEDTKSLALRLSFSSSPSSASLPSPLVAFLHTDSLSGPAAIYRTTLDTNTSSSRQFSTSRRLSECLSESTSSSELTDDEDGLALRRSRHKGRYRKPPNRESLSDLMCPICLDTYDDARTLSCGHSMCWECIEQMRISGLAGRSEFSEERDDPLSELQTTNDDSPGGTAHKLRVERDKTETEKMWVCTTCYRERKGRCCSSKPHSPIKRPSSLFLPERELDRDATTSPGSRSVDTPLTGWTTSERLAQYAFCATCLLSNHAGHEYEGLVKLRDRACVLERKREEYCMRAAAVVDEMRERAKQTIESSVCNPLLLMVTEKINSLADSIAADDEKDVEKRSEDVLHRLDEISKKFSRQAPSLFEDLLESCKSCEDSRRLGVREHSSRSLGLPTQL